MVPHFEIGTDCESMGLGVPLTGFEQLNCSGDRAVLMPVERKCSRSFREFLKRRDGLLKGQSSAQQVDLQSNGDRYSRSCLLSSEHWRFQRSWAA